MQLNSNLYHLLFDNISYDKTDKYIEVDAKNALDLKNNSIYKVNNSYPGVKYENTSG